MKGFAFALLVSFALLLSGCVSQPAAGGERMGVVASILPQKQIAERIGGSHVEVVVMVPPGASPHSYEPTPQQMAKVANSKVYFMVGSGVEFERAWMGKVLQTNPQLQVVNGSENIKLMEMQAHGHEEEEVGHEEEGMDPHVWTSITNTKEMAKSLHAALAGSDPANAQEYKANLDAYLSELDALDRETKASLAGAGSREFIVFHPAWGYFARDYNLEQIAMEDAGKEPTPQSLAGLVQKAKEHGIKVVFVSPQFSTQSADALANEIGGSVVAIDPLAEDYIGNMQNVVEGFKNALG